MSNASATKAIEQNEQAIFDEGNYLLCLTAYYGEGHMSMNLLKQFVIAYEHVSVTTAYRRIKKLIDAKFLRTSKRFDTSIVSITKPAYAKLLNIEYAKARVPQLTEERFKRGLFKASYALNDAEQHLCFEDMLNYHLTTSNLLLNELQCPRVLSTIYKQTNDTHLKEELSRLISKTKTRKSQISKNQENFKTKKDTYKVIREFYYEKYLTNNTPKIAEYLTNKKVQEYKILMAQEGLEYLPMPVEKKRHDTDYVDVQMLHKRNIYIADVDPANQYMHIVLLDVNRRCTAANMKKDLYAINTMLGRIFSNSEFWKRNLRITVYCSSANRAQSLLKQKKEVVYHLTDEVLKCNYIAELYDVLPLNLDKYVYDGKFIII